MHSVVRFCLKRKHFLKRKYMRKLLNRASGLHVRRRGSFVHLTVYLSDSVDGTILYEICSGT